jgi:hypothetical protein
MLFIPDWSWSIACPFPTVETLAAQLLAALHLFSRRIVQPHHGPGSRMGHEEGRTLNYSAPELWWLQAIEPLHFRRLSV